MLPTDQDSVAARRHKNPIGRQTQAIRRVRASTAEARSGLCFVRHHIGYRIPMPMPNDATASNILSGESPTAIKIAGSGRSAKTVRPNRAFRRRRSLSYFFQLSSMGPIFESPLFLLGRAVHCLLVQKQLFPCCYTYSIMVYAVQHLRRDL